MSTLHRQALLYYNSDKVFFKIMYFYITLICWCLECKNNFINADKNANLVSWKCEKTTGIPCDSDFLALLETSVSIGNLDHFQVWFQENNFTTFLCISGSLGALQSGPEHAFLFLLLWKNGFSVISLLQTRPEFASWFVLANADRHVANCSRHNNMLIRTSHW